MRRRPRKILVDPLPQGPSFAGRSADLVIRVSSLCAVDFMMGGVSAAVAKTAAAPIERIKLLVQNQGEMLKTGRLDKPYAGIADCARRTYADEGMVSCALHLLVLVVVGSVGVSQET